MKPLKQHFILPDQGIYMGGHSLGPCSKAAVESVTATLNDWSKNAVLGWDVNRWMQLPFTVGAKIADLIGAKHCEVVMSDSTSVNLYKALNSALLLNDKRKVVLTDPDNFPTDLYIAQGLKDVTLKYAKVEHLLESMDESIAVLMLTQVNYRTGYIYDLDMITKKAHALGIIVIWDLSHSVGAIPVDLSTSQPDFAVGCTYKYLNGGPGSPSFIYINQRHHEHTRSPITGWLGHQTPFAFDGEYKPAIGPAKYLVGSPYVLNLKALEGAMTIYEDINMQSIRESSLQNSEFLMLKTQEFVPEFVCVSPADSTSRGGHVAFMHHKAQLMTQALIDKGVICDFRQPNLIRMCVNPFYLSVEDLQRCITIMKEVTIC